MLALLARLGSRDFHLLCNQHEAYFHFLAQCTHDCRGSRSSFYFAWNIEIAELRAYAAQIKQLPFMKPPSLL